MTENHRKVQMTVRLDPNVFQAAKDAERRTGTPRSIIVAAAARQVLLPPPHESAETRMENLSIRVLTRLEAVERRIGTELAAVKELLALTLRTYLNHTPAVPETQRDAASLSGRARFAQLVELLNRNVTDGLSILDEMDPNHAP